MKQLFTIILSGTILLSGCQGQQSKLVNSNKQDNTISSFEEKQQQDLKQDGAAITKMAAPGFNFRYAAKKATPGVVHIKSSFTIQGRQQSPDFFRDFFDDDFWRQYFPQEGKTPQVQTGSASGVIVSSDGYIVTNNHVIADAENIEIVLHDQRNYKAKLIGTDPATDLALLKIDEKNLSFIEFGNSDSVEVGDMVLAVGNPFNLASTVTAGIVSAKARNINLITDRSAVESYIQTDAAVNRGNSGGALVDINGRLIGINAAIATPTGVYAGYSFAVPIEIVKKIIDDLLRHGKVLRGFLGVIISDMNGEKAKSLGIANTTGVMVDSLQANSAAVNSGVLIKDVITMIDSRKVETATELREIIARHRPGEKIVLTVIRNGQEKLIPVILLPAQEAASNLTPGSEILKTLGIEIENLSSKEKDQFKISGGVKITKISAGKVSAYTEIKEGFIVTKINGRTIADESEFTRELKDRKGGVMLEGIYPGLGGVFYYAFGL